MGREANQLCGQIGTECVGQRHTRTRFNRPPLWFIVGLRIVTRGSRVKLGYARRGATIVAFYATLSTDPSRHGPASPKAPRCSG